MTTPIKLLSITIIAAFALLRQPSFGDGPLVLGLLFLLACVDAGRVGAMGKEGSATEQAAGFLGGLASLAVWPFHIAVVALAVFGLQEPGLGGGAATAKVVAKCATCATQGGGGCGGAAGGSCGSGCGGNCGSSKSVTASKPGAGRPTPVKASPAAVAARTAIPQARPTPSAAPRPPLPATALRPPPQSSLPRTTMQPSLRPAAGRPGSVPAASSSAPRPSGSLAPTGVTLPSVRPPATPAPAASSIPAPSPQ